MPIEDIVAALLEKHDIITALLHGCDYDSSPTRPAERSPSTRSWWTS